MVAAGEEGVVVVRERVKAEESAAPVEVAAADQAASAVVVRREAFAGGEELEGAGEVVEARSGCST